MYRYSNRLPWTFHQNDLSQLQTAHEQSSDPLLDLTSVNPTTCFSDYPHAAIQQAFAGIDDFSYWPDALGMAAARVEISRYYAARHIAIDYQRILLTASTSEAYAMLFKLLCNPGDEVLVPTPSYPLFDYLAALEGVIVVPYRMRYDGAWYVDFDHLKQQISERARAIVIVNPNNPTGTFLTGAERDALFDVASANQLPIISDEVFMDYDCTPRSSIVKTLIGCDKVLSFSLNGLSKAAGMPQMKLAWMIINGPAEECVLARERMELVNDTYLSVATPVQKALAALLSTGARLQTKIKERIADNLMLIDETLAGTASHRLHLDGGWSAILQMPNTRSEEAWVSGLLREQHVLVQPGYFFDMPSNAYLVVSLLTECRQLQEGLERMKRQLSGA